MTFEQVHRQLNDPDLATRVRTIRSLPGADLQSHQTLRFVEAILHLSGHLSLKIEALTILPQIVKPETYTETIRVLHAAFGDPDPEVLRNGLLALQRLPADFPFEALLSAVFTLLSAEDTDLQYHAVLSLARVRAPRYLEELRSRIGRLCDHPNRVLRDAARAAVFSLHA